MDFACMDMFWILLGVAGWGLALWFAWTLMRMAGDEDRAARHQEKRFDPTSDVTITRLGPDTGA
jgi:hypothetical protein